MYCVIICCLNVVYYLGCYLLIVQILCTICVIICCILRSASHLSFDLSVLSSSLFLLLIYWVKTPLSFISVWVLGAVAASALTLTKNSAAAVLRTGSSVASQIPAAPSVPSVSVSVPVQGLASALSRSQVISAIRTTTPPAPRSTSPAVSISDHTRYNSVHASISACGYILLVFMTFRTYACFDI